MSEIYVKNIENKWVVSSNRGASKPDSEFTKTASKTDALRYARTCEQRTGARVVVLAEEKSSNGKDK